jgi:hypothetical protein
MSNNIKYHVYTLLWNDQGMIRALLKHYETAERIVVYDCGSTDGGPDLVLKAGRELRKMPKLDKLDDKDNIQMKNIVWRESVGRADFVIVQDTDEFVYFPEYPNDICLGLQKFKDEGVNASRVVCYSVVTSDEEWAKVQQYVSEQGRSPVVGLSKIARGDILTSKYMYDKPLIFNPNVVQSTNFGFGQHEWKPTYIANNTLKYPSSSPLMLHCRFIGENHEVSRMIASRERLKHQFHLGLGYQYNRTNEQIVSAVRAMHQHPDLFDGKSFLYPGLSRVTFNSKLENLLYPTAMAPLLNQDLCLKIADFCSPKEKGNTLFVETANSTSYAIVALASGAQYAQIIAQENPELRRAIFANGWGNLVKFKKELDNLEHIQRIIFLDGAKIYVQEK